MNDTHILRVSKELNLSSASVRATAELLGEDATVPFIARYRKEMTGGIDEVQITQIRDRLAQLAELDNRREAILKSLIERELLTGELKGALTGALTMTALEDIYLPFRPKRRTRATIAKEKGLEPLALWIMEQTASGDPAEAEKFINAEKGVASTDEALAGARDIIAEMVNEDKEARTILRNLFSKEAAVSSKVIKDKEVEGAKFKDYFDRHFAYKDGSLHDELKNHPLQTSYPKTASHVYVQKINFTWSNFIPIRAVP